jgi:PAS domain-containing protein
LTPRELLGGRAGRAALARESLLRSLPALAGLAGLLLAGVIGPVAFALGWLAGLAVAALFASARLRQLEGIAAWIERLPDGQAGPDSGDTAPATAAGGGELADRLLRPVAELARRVGREGRRAAAQGRMLDSVVEAVPDPILVVDAGLEVVRANAAAKRDFGVGGRVQQPLARVLRDPGVLAAVNGALRAGTASNVTFAPALDRTKQFGARIEPVDLGEQGRGALLALREQTEQVMIERMRSDFVANASHEIRNPLGRDPGDHRDPARAGPARPQGARHVPGGHGRRGRAHGPAGRRPPLPLAHRALGPPAADRALRPGGDPGPGAGADAAGGRRDRRADRVRDRARAAGARRRRGPAPPAVREPDR